MGRQDLQPCGGVGLVTVTGISRVDEALGFEKKHVALLFGDGAVFNPLRYDDQLAFAQPNRPVTKLHGEFTVNHQKEFVFALMRMPIKGALEFGQFDFLPIESGNDPRGPMLRKSIKTGAQVDGLHDVQRLPQPAAG